MKLIYPVTPVVVDIRPTTKNRHMFFGQQTITFGSSDNVCTLRVPHGVTCNLQATTWRLLGPKAKFPILVYEYLWRKKGRYINRSQFLGGPCSLMHKEVVKLFDLLLKLYGVGAFKRFVACSVLRLRSW